MDQNQIVSVAHVRQCVSVHSALNPDRKAAIKDPKSQIRTQVQQILHDRLGTIGKELYDPDHPLDLPPSL